VVSTSTSWRHDYFAANGRPGIQNFVSRSCSLGPRLYNRSLLPEVPGRRPLKKKNCRRLYELGGDSVVAAGDSVVAAGLVVSVVVGGLVAAGVAAGSVVSVFCSHAARSVAPARMQMYFFIVLVRSGTLL
jgi:hypothetical protein